MPSHPTSVLRLPHLLRSTQTLRTQPLRLALITKPHGSYRHASTLPPAGHFSQKITRFRKYDTDAPTDDPDTLRPRNPLNYIDGERMRLRRNDYWRKRMYFASFGLILSLMFQAWLYYSFYDDEAYRRYKEGKPSRKEEERIKAAGNERFVNPTAAGASTAQRLDAPPGAPGRNGEPVRVKAIQDKPGDPNVKIDDQGYELVETGTSTIPHFPKTIKIPSSTAAPGSERSSSLSSSGAAPAAQPTSSTPGIGAEEGLEEYSLLGLGIRTVSFLGIQVYVLGMYVRSSDLDTLQAAFVRHVNPLGSSLIPSEKDSLRRDLLSEEASLAIWDKVLKETRVRSAVRIVPTRGTDFDHLRDGWVTGITNRTRALSQASEGGRSEWDEPSFGEGMQEMKKLLTGRGKAPKGSMVLLTRDERGVMRLIFEGAKKVDSEGMVVVERAAVGDVLGTLGDERVCRQIWMGYLGGRNVSSEGARRSIVEGVMDLVERPVGTVGSQVT